MTLFIIKIIYVYIIGFLLAVLEIQIEGKGGWAANLPTWRPGEKSRLAKAVQKVSNKDLTGYHLALMPLLLLFFHLPYVWGTAWNWLSELETLTFFVIFAVFWDFLWFVLHPHYSLSDFGPQQIWWHKKWWGRLPVDYYIGLMLTFVLFLPLMLVDPFYIVKFVLLIGGIVILTMVTIWFYPKAY